MTFDMPHLPPRARLTGARLAGVLALTMAMSLSAAAQTANPAKPAPKPARPVPNTSAAAPVVCTKYGCKPLPAHCHAETEFNWEGPTGYQIVVCP